MDFSIKLHTIKSGWSIVYIEGVPVVISKDRFCLSKANSADPDEMPLYAAIHLGLHCLPRYLLGGFWSSMG